MKKCSFKDCDREASPKTGGGLCNAHYHRARRNAKMDVKLQERGKGWISSHGYRYVGHRAEHRLIAEGILKRKLGYNEIVHHADENPLNNSIDNLRVIYRGDHARLHNIGKTNEQRKRKPDGLAGKP